MTEPRRRRPLRNAAVLYLVLLGLSHLVAGLREPPPPRSAADRTARVPEVEPDGTASATSEVELAWREVGPDRPGPVLVLLHGSPGSSSDFNRFAAAPALAGRRILIPDLPGFGRSAHEVPDYSVAAHARYVLELADRLGIEQLDVAGYSMGGGVALELAHQAPDRVRSLELVSAIGVQELELFGDYELNHLVHGAQLVAMRVLPWVVPHFGLWTGQFMGIPYARNFYDTDQRPMRGYLLEWDGPALVVHGGHDFLVPIEAAREHHRLLPQSRLVVLDAGHFHMFIDPVPAATAVGRFLDRVDRGEAPRRAEAAPDRVAGSLRPFDPSVIPPLAGPGLLLILALIALATFVSEDLTCIGAGLLVAQGRIGLAAAATACFLGILAGDMLLYLAGRFFGRPALERAPLSWFTGPEAVERAAAWFETRGGRVVFLARFVPGLRLPTYVAAGVLHQRFLTFAGYFVLAGLLWTPLFVAFASWAGTEARELVSLFESWALPVVAVLVLGLLAVQRVLLPALTHRGRRMLVGKWTRLRHWEFWPPWLTYLPVVPWVAWLALRHRGLALVTAVNPGIPTGGFIGESKSAILELLRDEEGHVARHCLIRADLSAEQRLHEARRFLDRHGLDLPLVLKPDVGQRGSGVQVLHDGGELERALQGLRVDSILQEHVPGREYGLFWVQRPSEPAGRIFSITEKVLPSLTGDGESTLEELILRDPRAVAMADAYLDANAKRLTEVPAAGRSVRLVELGTHCRGAVFLDGGRLATEQLRQALQAVSDRFEGFWFGRYDVFAESEEALRRGEFRIIELNGLTSEATHVYDPRVSLVEAYRVLFEQWSLAFEIAAECRARGTRPASLAELVRETLAYRKLARGHHATAAAEPELARS